MRYYRLNVLLNNQVIASYKCKSIDDCVIRFDEIMKDEYVQVIKGNILEMCICYEEEGEYDDWYINYINNTF